VGPHVAEKAATNAIMAPTPTHAKAGADALPPSAALTLAATAAWHSAMATPPPMSSRRRPTRAPQPLHWYVYLLCTL
jgi:hypothetical protein